jgi:DNA (cytosine-5)-methyltransferase 1
MSENYNLFEMIYEPYKITKPIRLIELFGGVGSQAMALRNIGANFEHYRLVEFDKYPIASYNAIHGTNFEPKDITKIKAEDLGITETDKYQYIMTYSFPCQDLSLAGKQKGMSKGSGTRSGLLWEVERLLTECKELPQILLMENVPNVIGKKNISDFLKWETFLEKLGYKNYVEILNAKDYGIPQNRRRCFMVSLLGEYCYTFPNKQNLKLILKYMLEEKVDEKYYLSKKMIDYISATNPKWTGNNNGAIINKNIASTINTGEGGRRCDASNYVSDDLPDNYDLQSKQILIHEATKKGYAVAQEGDGVYINRPQQKRGVVQKGMIQTIKTSPDVGVVVVGNYSPSNHNANPPLTIRKPTPKECWRLMGFSDEDFEKAAKVNSNAQLYKQAGNSIVVNVLEAIFRQLL